MRLKSRLTALRRGRYDADMVFPPSRQSPSPAATGLALIWAGNAGSAFATLQPGVVGALMDDLALSSQQAGLLCALQLGFSCLANVLLLATGRVLSRVVLAVGLMGLAAAHLASAALRGPVELMVCQSLAGLCAGAVFAVAASRAAQAPRAQLLLASFGVAQAVIGVLGYLTFPALVRAQGCTGVFLALGVLALSALPGLSAIEPGPLTPGESPLRSLLVPGRREGLLLGSSFLCNAGLGGASAYLERIGLHAGLSPELVSRCLAGSMLGMLLGSAFALWSGLRGRAESVLVPSLGILVASCGLLLAAGQPVLYGLGLLGIIASPVVLIPAYLASLARPMPGSAADAGAPVRGLVAIGIGMAAGPAVAGMLIAAAGYAPMIAAATLTLLLATGLAAGALGHRAGQAVLAR